MKLRNENLEEITINEKIVLIEEIAKSPELSVTEEEAQEALAKLVYSAQAYL